MKDMPINMVINKYNDDWDNAIDELEALENQLDEQMRSRLINWIDSNDDIDKRMELICYIDDDEMKISLLKYLVKIYYDKSQTHN